MKELTSEEVKSLLKKYGPNTLTEQKKRSVLKIFFEQFESVLTVLLLIAAVLSMFVGEVVDASLIVTIVLLNAFFGLYQELKAEAAIAALKKMTISLVRVIRDGKHVEINSVDLVPGDIVYIEEGVKVPADGVLIEPVNTAVNESALTGESLPVSKEEDEEVYMGTIVSRGRAYMQVTKTGMKTRFGKVAESLQTIEEHKTPLQIKLEKLSEIIGIVGILASIVVMGLSYGQGEPYFQSFLLGVSLAVAMVPEGLPAVMTITLAIGLRDMAKKKAVLRKLSAIEALGSVTVIATDKTGTLTRNEMTVDKYYTNGVIQEIGKDKKITDETFEQILLNGVLCSTANLEHKKSGYKILGDPTEGALLILAKQFGYSIRNTRNEWKILNEEPFNSEIKRMSVTVRKGKKKVTFSKGAPESIFHITNKMLKNGKKVALTPAIKKEIKKVQEAWSKEGYRVLAFATNDVLTGLVAMHDPPRLEAKDALIKAKQAGIRVIMITGDNPVTATAIAEAIGLMEEGDTVLLGEEVEVMNNTQLKKALKTVRIFSRVSPFHKSRIVKVLQSMGEIVAVTGDGVNDAVALKQANVGVAMGRVGTDVARETADMIIMDDNFATIVTAIEEGRNIIKNLKNAIKYLLTTNLAEALAIIGSLILGIPTLFYAVQILYINLISDGIPALALAFSPRIKTIMNRPPDKKLTLLKSKDILYIATIGTLTAIFVVTGYLLFDRTAMAGRAAAFCILALIQSFVFIDLWVSHKSVMLFKKSFTSREFIVAFGLPFLIQFAVMRIEPVAEVFHITTISIPQFFLFMLCSSLIFFGIKLFHLIAKRPEV